MQWWYTYTIVLYTYYYRILLIEIFVYYCKHSKDCIFSYSPRQLCNYLFSKCQNRRETWKHEQSSKIPKNKMQWWYTYTIVLYT
jgi:hypothetical protein